MKVLQVRWAYCLVVLALVIETCTALPRTKRQTQLEEDSGLTPIEENETSDGSIREKRKLEGFTQAKFGVSNAILGVVFGKINQLIDSKTRLVDTLDKQNIEKNKMYGIEAPQNGLSSLSSVFSSVIGPKLQFIGPKLNLFTGLLGGLSGSKSQGSGSGPLGGIISLVTSLSGSSSGGLSGAPASADSEYYEPAPIRQTYFTPTPQAYYRSTETPVYYDGGYPGVRQEPRQFGYTRKSLRSRDISRSQKY